MELEDEWSNRRPFKFEKFWLNRVEVDDLVRES